MAQEEAIKLFDAKKIRVMWDDQTEKHYFSIIYINSQIRLARHNRERIGSRLSRDKLRGNTYLQPN